MPTSDTQRRQARRRLQGWATKRLRRLINRLVQELLQWRRTVRKTGLRMGGTSVPAAEHSPQPMASPRPTAQVADHQSPGQPADAPHRPAQEAIAEFFGRRALSTDTTFGDMVSASTQGTSDQAEHRVDQPVAFPGPVFDLLEGQIEDRPGEAAEHRRSTPPATGWSRSQFEQTTA